MCIVVIAIATDVAVSIIANAVQRMSTIARHELVLCAILVVVILAHADLLAKLPLCLELCAFY
jgi:hypothetical protein